MNKEVLFANTLKEITQLAKEQGSCVSEEQIQEAFAALELDKEQLMMVQDYLIKHNIGIGQPPNPEDYLTKEEKDYLQIYLDELTKLPDYSEGEKEAYTISAMAGDVQAQSKLIEANLANVVEIAKLYGGQGVFLEDLIGEGNVALTLGVTLLGCLEHPREAQGMLGKMIMDAMEGYIQENAENKKKDQRVVNKVNQCLERAKELSLELERKVTIEELSQETGMSRKQIMDAIRMSGFQIDYIEMES